MGARKWVIGGFLAAVLLVVGLGVYAARAKNDRERNQSESDLATAVARAEALGLPIYAEHLRGDPIPDEDNAWVEIEAIRDMMGGRRSPEGKWASLFDLLDVTDPTELDRLRRKVVEDWQPALELAKLAASKPGFDPRREWERGAMVDFADHAQTKNVSIVLVEEARLLFDAGDLESSLNSLQAVAALASFYYGERYWWSALVAAILDLTTAQEMVRQAGLDAPLHYKENLRELLGRMFQTADPKELLTAQIVAFVEMIRLVNEKSERGQRAFQEFHEEGFAVEAHEMFGSFLPAKHALEFEVKAISAACDFFESLSPDISEYLWNDEQYEMLVDAPYDWNMSAYVSQDDRPALPLGFIAMYDRLMIWTPGETPGPFARNAKKLLVREVFLAAFDHVAGTRVLSDGATWNSTSIPLAEIVFTTNESGFSITATAPGLDPITLKIDRPE